MAATAVTHPATNVTSEEATLNGTVNPDGTQGYAYFEYGPTTAYGNFSSEADVGSGSSGVPVSIRLDIGSPDTVQHYRVVLDTDVVPPVAFGDDLPARIPDSAGTTTIHVFALSELEAAIATVNPDEIISIDSDIFGFNRQLNVDCDGTLGTIEITGTGVLSGFSQINVTGSFVCLRGLEIVGNTVAGIKVSSGADSIEIDQCHIHDNVKTGILVASPCSNVQIWNNVIHDNGTTIADQGIAFAYARGDCVVGSNVVYKNGGYNIQVYPDAPGLILTCNTVDDAQVVGGTVVGSTPGALQTMNTISVGNLITRAVGYGVDLYYPGPGNNTYDALGFDNALGDFRAGTGMNYINCTHADPDFVDWSAGDYHLNGGSPAIDYVDPARYGFVPPTDIEGNVRVTADAGAYAA